VIEFDTSLTTVAGVTERISAAYAGTGSIAITKASNSDIGTRRDD
jgi:hypothetical protein